MSYHALTSVSNPDELKENILYIDYYSIRGVGIRLVLFWRVD